MTYVNSRVWLAALMMYFLSQIAVAGSPVTDSPRSSAVATLPEPTGPFAVGKITVPWTDESRIEPLSPNHEPRELMVDIWYPAEPSNGVPVAYLDTAAYQRALGEEGFRDQFGNASETIKAGVRTHAVAGAPYSLSAGLSPVLIFSPGGGMIREVDTAQLEDLASHGYVVAAISHPYDAIVTIFPDGRQIAYSSQRWPKPPSLEGEANLNQLEWHANDIRFVLDELSRANATDPTALPFAGRLDLDHVGAFGHSFGGIAAAHACQIDRRIKACLNEDGVVAKKPFYLDARGWGLDQSFMLVLRDPPTRPLSDAEVAAMKMSRQRLEQIMARVDAYQETALRSTGKGSYRVRLRNNITTHMDFSDLAVLGARDRVDAERRAAILAVVRNYTLAFFDKYLRGMTAELLDEAATGEFVEAVQEFAPAKSPCPLQ
jgi:predicted dienelactone hydrolase